MQVQPIFKNTSGTWSQLSKLVSKEPNFADEFGCSVAISEDYAIVGAPYEGTPFFEPVINWNSKVVV